ncbi:hypothetical protein [Streptomyces atratus]|uniref:hypothetical protein n=1 Tax=Streptomyces atratus TaxID=1893 RepID=UPI0033F05D0B
MCEGLKGCTAVTIGRVPAPEETASLSKPGSDNPHTPHEGAEFDSKSSFWDHFSMSLANALAQYDDLTKVACVSELEVACEGSGDDYVLDSSTVDEFLQDKGVSSKIERQLTTWEGEASKRCSGKESCVFTADSGWRNASFQGFDAFTGIGNVKYRINASVSGECRRWCYYRFQRLPLQGLELRQR